MVRKWQIEFCDGNKAAAALLSFFEYWHNIKLEQSRKAGQANDVAEAHGETRAQDESLLQFHTEKELGDGVLLFGRHAIREGIKILEDKGVITIHGNPNPRYSFDKTRYFLFHPSVVNDWIAIRSKSPDRSGENASRSGENASRSGENAATRTEITTEITTEEKENPPTPQTPETPNGTGKRDFSSEQAQAEYRKIYPTLSVTGQRYTGPAEAEEIKRRNQFSTPDDRRALARRIAEIAGFVDPDMLERTNDRQFFAFEGIASYLFEHNIDRRIFALALRNIINDEQASNGGKPVYAGTILNNLPLAIQQARSVV
jgi:hypothetical protein